MSSTSAIDRSRPRFAAATGEIPGEARDQSRSQSPNRSVDRRLSGGWRMPCRHGFRRTRATSYSGQFVTRYLALGNLWRRLALNLYGIGFQNCDDGTTAPVYRRASTWPSVQLSIPHQSASPPGEGDGASCMLPVIRAPKRFAGDMPPPATMPIRQLPCPRRHQSTVAFL
jgi:hypothetical protein